MSPKLDAYILAQAGLRASLLVATAAFPADDWEDLRQEIAFDALRRAPKFNPERGDWQGFVRGVTRNYSIVLITRFRRRAYREVSLEEIFAGAKGEVDCESLCACVVSGLAVIERRLGIEQVINTLPSHLGALARSLKHRTITEVCAETGLSRTRIYQLIRQLRTVFAAAGYQPACCPRRGAHAHSTGSTG